MAATRTTARNAVSLVRTRITAGRTRTRTTRLELLLRLSLAEDDNIRTLVLRHGKVSALSEPRQLVHKYSQCLAGTNRTCAGNVSDLPVVPVNPDWKLKALHREKQATDTQYELLENTKDMPKRQGYIYDQMWQWDTLKEADRVSTRRKKNYGVKKHKKQWLKDLVEVQTIIHDRKMCTDEYKHMEVNNGKKKRQISKLNFHPNHLLHQALVLVSHDRIERTLISHTYASRIGYGQIAGALQVKKWLREESEECLWYAQGDICHYYANIQHTLLRRNMEHIFKDKEFINAYMEPFERFTSDGKGIPLGIRPSQDSGNIALMTFDRHMKEVTKAHLYLRYLDDFILFEKTKGEVKRKMKMAIAYLKGLGFELHEPKIRPISEGLDFLGYVFYEGGDMFWRKSNKVRWLKRRAKVTNKRRLHEIDAAAWGMIKWGNRHCKRLYKMETGIDMSELGIELPKKTDKMGMRIIDAPKITSSVALNSELEVVDWVRNVETSFGMGRYALEVVLYGKHHKLIVNTSKIKQLIDGFALANVTSFTGVFKDEGGNHFYFDKVRVTRIDNRLIGRNDDGKLIFTDTNELIDMNAMRAKGAEKVKKENELIKMVEAARKAELEKKAAEQEEENKKQKIGGNEK